MWHHDVPYLVGLGGGGRAVGSNRVENAAPPPTPLATLNKTLKPSHPWPP